MIYKDDGSVLIDDGKPYFCQFELLEKEIDAQTNGQDLVMMTGSFMLRNQIKGSIEDEALSDASIPPGLCLMNINEGSLFYSYSDEDEDEGDESDREPIFENSDRDTFFFPEPDNKATISFCLGYSLSQLGWSIEDFKRHIDSFIHIFDGVVGNEFEFSFHNRKFNTKKLIFIGARTHRGKVFSIKSSSGRYCYDPTMVSGIRSFANGFARSMEMMLSANDRSKDVIERYDKELGFEDFWFVDITYDTKYPSTRFAVFAFINLMRLPVYSNNANYWLTEAPAIIKAQGIDMAIKLTLTLSHHIKYGNQNFRNCMLNSVTLTPSEKIPALRGIIDRLNSEADGNKFSADDHFHVSAWIDNGKSNMYPTTKSWELYMRYGFVKNEQITTDVGSALIRFFHIMGYSDASFLIAKTIFSVKRPISSVVKILNEKVA